MNNLPPEVLRDIFGLATDEHDSKNDIIWTQSCEWSLDRFLDSEWTLAVEPALHLDPCLDHPGVYYLRASVEHTTDIYKRRVSQCMETKQVRGRL